MRKIAKCCNVSSNSIYTRFKDKEGLFNAIVSNSANTLMDIYLKCIDMARDVINSSKAINIGNDGTNNVLKYIYDHFDDFKLIFCCSNGTRYEKYFDKLAKVEEEFYQEIAKKFSERKIDDFFIHVICTNGCFFVYELIFHDKKL